MAKKKANKIVTGKQEQAKDNIGAVKKSGDTMSGALTVGGALTMGDAILSAPDIVVRPSDISLAVKAAAISSTPDCAERAGLCRRSARSSWKRANTPHWNH